MISPISLSHLFLLVRSGCRARSRTCSYVPFTTYEFAAYATRRACAVCHPQIRWTLCARSWRAQLTSHEKPIQTSGGQVLHAYAVGKEADHEKALAASRDLRTNVMEEVCL